MIFIAALLLGISIAGIAILLFAVHAAPEGFEDELGFHRLR